MISAFGMPGLILSTLPFLMRFSFQSVSPRILRKPSAVEIVFVNVFISACPLKPPRWTIRMRQDGRTGRFCQQNELFLEGGGEMEMR